MARHEPTLWKNSGASPFAFLAEMEREMNKLFSDYWPEVSNHSNNGRWDVSSFTPSCEVEDHDNHYLLSVDLPGLKREDLKVELQDNVLSISGERRRETQKESDGGHYTERSYGRFQRSFTLPRQVNCDKIESHFQDGVLSLYLPKTQASKTKKIAISSDREEFEGKCLSEGSGCSESSERSQTQGSDKSDRFDKSESSRNSSGKREERSAQKSSKSSFRERGVA